ncbi:MAG: dipeptidase, partial [Clostridia bacterium]|nr:dipeptidase [Clostridia bacterium]
MIISDSHTDFLTAIKTQAKRKSYVEQIAKFKPTICAAVFTTGKNITLRKLKNYKKEIENYNKIYHTHFLFTIEDLGFVKSIFDLVEVVKLKPFAVTLTWNNKNQFAGGANSKGGLTKFGKKAIKLLEENGVKVDCAHLNRKSFWQFARLTTKPIFVSHTNLNCVHPHGRNLTNKQIEFVAKSGGYVGITLYQKFILEHKITPKDVAIQFAKIKDLVGTKNCG